MDAFGHGAQLEYALTSEHGGDGCRPIADIGLPEDVKARLMAGMADRRGDEETVQLRFGQPIRAQLLDRVLRGDHHERLRHGARDAVHGDMPFLHHLEQRGLGFRRRAVDLVGQHDR